MSDTAKPERFKAQRSLWNDEKWEVQENIPCINGLSAWFTIAVCDAASEPEQGYSDGAFGTAEERAKRIAKALNNG